MIGVTETWLSDSNCELFDIPGYNFIEKHRNEKTGGGLGIFCQNSIQFTLRDDLSLFTEYLESVFIEIPSYAFHLGQTVLIGTIYRPPGMDLYQFNTLLCDIPEKMRGWVGLWGFLWWAPSAKRKNHHGVSSGWSNVWHWSNTGLSSTQYEQIPIILRVWPFWLTPFFFGQ